MDEEMLAKVEAMASHRELLGMPVVRESTKPAEYEWEDIGIVHSQYFQGRGTSHTDWDTVHIGIGVDAQDAADDALETAACSGWDVSGVAIPTDFDDEVVEYDDEDEEDNELWYYVAIYLRGYSK